MVVSLFMQTCNKLTIIQGVTPPSLKGNCDWLQQPLMTLTNDIKKKTDGWTMNRYIHSTVRHLPSRFWIVLICKSNPFSRRSHSNADAGLSFPRSGEPTQLFSKNASGWIVTLPPSADRIQIHSPGYCCLRTWENSLLTFAAKTGFSEICRRDSNIMGSPADIWSILEHIAPCRSVREA